MQPPVVASVPLQPASVQDITMNCVPASQAYWLNQSTRNRQVAGFLKNLCRYFAMMMYPMSRIGSGINQSTGNHIE